MPWGEIIIAAVVVETVVALFFIALCRSAKAGDRVLGYEPAAHERVQTLYVSRPAGRTWSPSAPAR